MMNQISELPPDIIHHIYSSLPTKDVVKTSLLSKFWHSCFLSNPTVDFDQSLFISSRATLIQSQSEKQLMIVKISKNMDFLIFAKDTIVRLYKHKLNIQQFRLNLMSCESVDTYEFDNRIAAEINQISKEVLEFNKSSIRVLELCNCDWALCQFNFPCLKKLSLCNCDMTSFLSNLPCVAKLSLKEVKLNDTALEKLLNGCPAVSDFCYDQCVGVKKLHVSGFQKLRILKVILPWYEKETRVLIDVPVLESLWINGGSIWEVKLVTGLNLKNVILEYGLFVDSKFVEDLVSMSPILESLAFSSVEFLHTLNISSHHLKNLKIDKCWNLKKSVIDAPNLHSFDYEGDLTDEIWFLSSAPQVKLELHNRHHQLCELKRFLEGKKIKDLTISYRNNLLTSYAIPVINGSNCEVQHLSLLISNLKPSESKKVMGGLFSICHPKSVSVECDAEFAKVLRMKLMGSNKYPECCRHRKKSKKKHKCWVQKLKKWNIERIEETAYRNRSEVVVKGRPVGLEDLLDAMSLEAAKPWTTIRVCFSLTFA